MYASSPGRNKVAASAYLSCPIQQCLKIAFVELVLILTFDPIAKAKLGFKIHSTYVFDAL